ncbi:MAG: glycoside hydrolase family 16 protein [Mucilaginibacter sp.]|nr:glycoside hydrolase family 16 protein [Mucilaginibacter sp.]
MFVSCKKDNTNKVPPVKTDTTAVTPVYALVWSDEFDGTNVDATKWTFETGNLDVNSEEEYYQPQNAAVSNGNLVITAKKELVGDQPYTSARMNTLGKFSQTYGRIEARIKLPMGQGMWPAFWMLGTNITTVSWPQCGELDIMEHINDTGSIYGTMHWNVNGHVSYGHTTTTTPADYHIYAIEWDANEIRWYVDSTLYQTGNIKDNVNTTGAFHLPFFILLNLAVGGSFPGQTVDESLLPESMYVDYVRVYKQTN